MRTPRLTLHRFAVLLVAAGLAAPAVASAQDTSLEGAWIVTSWTSDGEVDDTPAPGLFVFTKNHYSMMFIVGGPRVSYDAEAGMSDEETLHAYGTIIANSGRYEVDGNTLTTVAYVAKDPNYMNAFPDNGSSYTFSVEDGMLHLTFGDGGPGAGRTAILRQVDGVEMR